MRYLKVMFLAFFGLIAFVLPVAAFSTHNVTLQRTFNKYQEAPKKAVTVTVALANLESNALRGFYFTEQIPQGLSLQTVSVKVNGNNVSNYAMEAGLSGDVYTGCVPYRWILETPSAFSENNPIGFNSTLEIVYTVTSATAGNFDLNDFTWVGYFQTALEGQREAFGYSEEGDKQVITFAYKTLPWLPLLLGD